MSSFDFDYRGRPAALATRGHSYAADRAREINARAANERARAQALRTAGALAVGFLACVGSAAIGFNLAAHDRANDGLRTYQLVQFHDEESDIIDYDLTRADCAKRLQDRARGAVLACELSN